MSEKIYKVQMNAKGMPNFSTAVEIADRQQGEWIDRSDGGRILNPWWETYECSKCGQYGTRIWNFCPQCGARMKGADDDM